MCTARTLHEKRQKRNLLFCYRPDLPVDRHTEYTSTVLTLDTLKATLEIALIQTATLHCTLSMNTISPCVNLTKLDNYINIRSNKRQLFYPDHVLSATIFSFNIMSYYCITTFYVKEMFMNSRLIQILSKKAKHCSNYSAFCQLKKSAQFSKLKKIDWKFGDGYWKRYT